MSAKRARRSRDPLPWVAVASFLGLLLLALFGERLALGAEELPR